MGYSVLRVVAENTNSEVMLCDFTAGVEVVSFHHLTARELDPRWKGPPRRKDMDSSRNDIVPINLPTNFRVLEAGGWHNYFP